MYAMKFTLCSDILCYRNVEALCQAAFHHLFHVSSERHRLHKVRSSSVHSFIVCVYSRTSLSWTLWNLNSSPYYVLITEVSSIQRSFDTLQYYTETQRGVLIVPFHFQSERTCVMMTMRTWPQEDESVCIYSLTRLYENGVSVDIRFGRRFQISPLWLFV